MALLQVLPSGEELAHGFAENTSRVSLAGCLAPFASGDVELQDTDPNLPWSLKICAAWSKLAWACRVTGLGRDEPGAPQTERLEVFPKFCATGFSQSRHLAVSCSLALSKSHAKNTLCCMLCVGDLPCFLRPCHSCFF